MKNTDKIFYTKVIIDGDDTILLFPEDLIKDMNLKNNQILEWHFEKDGSLVIKPTNIISNTVK